MIYRWVGLRIVHLASDAFLLLNRFVKNNFKIGDVPGDITVPTRM